MGITQLAYDERARDDGFAGNVMLVVALSSLGGGEDLRIRMGPSDLAGQSMLNDWGRRRASLFFYMRKGQGKTLKFDHREPTRGNQLWNFSNQVHDNVFWSLGSGVLQLTMFQVVIMWLMANEYVPTISLTSNPILFVAGLVLLPIWSAFHFYWVHRLLHVPFIYKHVHS